MKHVMKLFAIIATVVAFIYAAPTHELEHPSPVNPDVLVAVKPEEKIILITDSKEIVKFKRETKQPLYPTLLPKEHVHHITKRDIPVPLVAKHHHPEESPNSKEIIEKKSHEYGKGEKTENQTLPQTPPLTLTEITSNTQQHKRDIPVPLVPKHQHPEESPKDNNENQLLVSQQAPEILVHEQENNSKDGQHTPPSLAASLKGTTMFLQKEKRETKTPLVPDQKSSEHKETQQEYKEEKSENPHVSQIHPISQTLPIQNHEHQKFSTHQDVDNPKDNQHHDTFQTVPGHNHKNLAVEGVPKPKNLAAHNEHNIVPTDIQNQDHYHSENSKGAQTTPKYYQQQHKIHEIFNKSQKRSSDHKKEVKKSTDEHPHDDVHVENLSESKSSQNPIHHKPKIFDDHLSVRDLTTSTEHPIIRQRPVPVAELFATSHDN